MRSEFALNLQFLGEMSSWHDPFTPALIGYYTLWLFKYKHHLYFVHGSDDVNSVLVGLIGCNWVRDSYICCTFSNSFRKVHCTISKYEVR